MRDVIDYKILSSMQPGSRDEYGLLTLEKVVKKHIEKGWTPIGGVQIQVNVSPHSPSRSEYFQSMVKYEIEAI